MFKELRKQAISNNFNLKKPRPLMLPGWMNRRGIQKVARNIAH